MSDFNQENQDDAPVAPTTTTTTSGTPPVTPVPVTETETPDATEHAAVTTTTGTPVTAPPVHTETTETVEQGATGTATTDTSPDTATAGATDHAGAAPEASTTGTTASGTATTTTTPPAPTATAAQVLSTTPAAAKDIILDSAVSTDVQLTGHTVQTTVSNFSHHDALVISADVLMGIATGELSIAATSTSVEIDNVATGQMLIHLNLDHAIGAVGIHPVAHGAVSVTL